MAAAGPILVIETSATGVKVSWSVLLAELGSEAPGPGVTEAVFTTTPTASGETRAVALKTTDAPTGMLTVVSMSPDPEAAHVPPVTLSHVHVTLKNAAGNASLTMAPTAVCG